MKMVQAEVGYQIGISMPGLALVIVQNGEIVLSKGWGDADIVSGSSGSQCFVGCQFACLRPSSPLPRHPIRPITDSATVTGQLP